MSRKAGMIYCNCCGRVICGEGDAQRASFLTIRKEWGYFSRDKDGEIHGMDICEPCYDSLVRGFAFAPEKENVTEIL